MGTNTGLQYLSYSEVLVLTLSCSLVTDSGLQHLPKEIETLVLDLSDSEITDSGLHYLPKGIKTLKLSVVYRSKITASGLGSFAVARAGLVAIHLQTPSFPLA